MAAFAQSQKLDSLQKEPPEVFCKKGFLKYSQNSQENTCARVSFLIKLQAFNFTEKIDSGTDALL